MLTPEQLQSARQRLNVPITATNPVVNNVASELDSQWGGDSTVTQPTKEKGIIGTATQSILGGAASMAQRPGELVGVGIAKAASSLTGKPEYYDRALAELDRPGKTAIGTDIRPISKETPKSVAAQALGTVGLGLGPVFGGAALGASMGLENDGGAGEIILDTIIGALGGKILDVGFKAASPYITKAVAKYGTPVIEQLQKTLPDYAKPYLDTLVTSGKKVVQTEADKALMQTSQTSIEDALGFVKKRNPTPVELKDAFVEGRTKTVGKKQDIITTPQQQRQAEALQPLVESGELKMSKDGLPTPEQRDVIIQRVEQLNQGVKQMVSNPKNNQSFVKKQLRQVLEDTKKDSSVIFASDPNIEKVYNALIEEAYKSVKTNNVEGLLEARQSFDKLPAVKKLLDGLQGATGENLKREAVLNIRRGMNNFAADLLDKAQSASIMKRLTPKQAKSLIEKSKKFAKKEDFVKYVKENMESFKDSGLTSSTSRKTQKGMNTENQYTTSLSDDLGELWDVGKVSPNAMTGELFIKTLRNESDLLGAVQSMSDNYPETFVEANKTFFQRNPTLKKSLIWGAGGLGMGYLGRNALGGLIPE